MTPSPGAGGIARMKDLRVAVTVKPALTLALAMLACLPGVEVRAEQWDGWFVGANVGASLSNVTYNTGPDNESWFRTAGQTANTWNRGHHADSDASPIGGLSVAYNNQVDSFVLGVELGLNAIDADLGHSVTYGIPGTLLNGTIQQRAEIKGLTTLRGRLGFAFDDSLVSLTGGLAAAWVESGFDYRDSDVGIFQYHGSGMDRLLKLGPTVGLAYEYMLPDDFVLKGEYSYVDLGQVKVSSMVRAADSHTIANIHSTSDLYLNIFTVGIEKKF